MTKEAEIDIVERLRGKVRVPVNDGAGPLDGRYFFERSFPTSKAALEAADEIERLRAAPVPAPDAGLVERLRDIIAPSEIGVSPIPKSVMGKINDVLALLSTRTVAGEPVAFDPMSIDDVQMRALLLCKDVGSGRQMLKRLLHPAPSGRDPATIEAAWKAGRDAALEVIQNVRHAGAANFTDARYAGQRGVDHGDALFDAYKAVKDLAAPAAQLTDDV